MSSNSAATVTTVKLKVLEIAEQTDGPEQPAVNVTLKKGKSLGEVGGTEVFQGKMKYCENGKKRTVDLVQAVFPANKERVMPGNVKLQINLKNCNEFIGPLVTIVPNDPTTVPTNCLDIKINPDNSAMLIVTFLEPKPGEFVAYPALYFHTSNGVIDPGLGVKREPG